MNETIIAKGVDFSSGFADFFESIGMTGTGLVTKGVAAVISVIAVRMLIQVSNDPRGALRKGGMAVGTLFVAVILAFYGDALFGTLGDGKKNEGSTQPQVRVIESVQGADKAGAFLRSNDGGL